ncbi:MAG TPA: GNAT family N-acetyltransferase [Pyrinomonadaceae bacterium]|jgi:Predicted acetyltransferase|nr:GNAT family N-acetyltransferase [Pyrinomonadaceae bacterium]
MNPSEIRTRLANSGDAEKITALINLAFKGAENFFVEGDRIDLKSVLELLEKGEFVIAESQGVMAGCVYIEPRGDRTYLGLLSVEPSRQQSGLGSLLMMAAEERCRARGDRFIDMLIVNLREELPGFYKKHGYVETGTSPFPEDVETKLPCHFINMSKEL